MSVTRVGVSVVVEVAVGVGVSVGIPVGVTSGDLVAGSSGTENLSPGLGGCGVFSTALIGAAGVLHEPKAVAAAMTINVFLNSLRIVVIIYKLDMMSQCRPNPLLSS